MPAMASEDTAGRAHHHTNVEAEAVVALSASLASSLMGLRGAFLDLREDLAELEKCRGRSLRMRPIEKEEVNIYYLYLI